MDNLYAVKVAAIPDVSCSYSADLASVGLRISSQCVIESRSYRCWQWYANLYKLTGAAAPAPTKLCGAALGGYDAGASGHGIRSLTAAAGRRCATRHLLRPVRDIQNFGTYLAQGAAENRPCPVSTGHVAAIDHMLRTRIAAVDGQVRVRMRMSTPGWATMQRVPGRCSSVGRAAVL